jgi:hypothetical protein
MWQSNGMAHVQFCAGVGIVATPVSGPEHGRAALSEWRTGWPNRVGRLLCSAFR